METITERKAAGLPESGSSAASAMPVKVLVVHNRYQQRGGEDVVFEEEADLLEANGHEVIRYVEDNDRVGNISQMALARKTLFNSSTYRELRTLLRRERPGVVHFHNTLPLVSPSGYYAAAAEKVPVIQTLHNYRLICPNGLFFRDGGPCEDCLGKTFPWPGVVHKCYRESRAATGLVATMTSAHKTFGTWTNKVDLYVALTEFARRKFVEGGLPPEKIAVKPNFVSRDPGVGDGAGGYALFVGRLSEEKGIKTLLAAWDMPALCDLPLKILGDGPLADLVRRAAKTNRAVEWLGNVSSEEVSSLMRQAAMLVQPSGAYETFGRVATESFAAGTPVISARLGAVAEIVGHGHTGRHFRPGDAADLARQVRHLTTHPSELARMRRNARSEFEDKYTAGRNYRMLTDIYASAIERAEVRT